MPVEFHSPQNIFTAKQHCSVDGYLFQKLNKNREMKHTMTHLRNPSLRKPRVPKLIWKDVTYTLDVRSSSNIQDIKMLC